MEMVLITNKLFKNSKFLSYSYNVYLQVEMYQQVITHIITVKVAPLISIRMVFCVITNLYLVSLK